MREKANWNKCCGQYYYCQQTWFEVVYDVWLQVWSTNNIEGVHRFLARVYRLITEQPVSASAPSQPQLRLLHATIKKVLVSQMQLEHAA